MSNPSVSTAKDTTKDKGKKTAAKKGGKPGEPDVELGPDGKPIPPVPLTETEMVQLQIEDKVSEVCEMFCFIIFFSSQIESRTLHLNFCKIVCFFNEFKTFK